MEFSVKKINEIKLIVWDLDETFWNGTLSDNEQIFPIQKNIDLIKNLTARGIVNSICSKNDEQSALQKLNDFGVDDFFVFKSINWSPKARRVADIIKNMSLRANNVLFVDDNPTNRAEVETYCPDIMTASPEQIEILCDNVNMMGKDDSNYSRLKQYKILETKFNAVKDFDSDIDFLNDSNIQVAFDYNPIDHIERILELLLRSNQLNYTKARIRIEELREILLSKEYKTASIYAKDKYGNYGLVGFYALKCNKLEHFFFSCRVLGMGLEQYVYSTLNYPQLDVVAPVSGTLDATMPKPSYIKEIDLNEFFRNDKGCTKEGNALGDANVLLKGPCDLQVMRSYLNSDSIDVEFNFIDNKGNQNDFYNHSAFVLNSYELPDELKQLSRKYSFISEESFNTEIFSGKYNVVCYSPLMDATLAVYRQKGTNLLMPFGIYTKPITDKSFQEEYLEKKIMTARSNFTIQEIEAFSDEFETIEYTPKLVASNIRKMVDIILGRNPQTIIVIILLSELEYIDGPKTKVIFKDKHLLHKEINAEIKMALDNVKNVKYIDVNRYVQKQSDYLDSINHYAKMVYYKMGKDFMDIVKESGVSSVQQKNLFGYLYYNFKKYMYGTKIYNNIRGKK